LFHTPGFVETRHEATAIVKSPIQTSAATNDKDTSRKDGLLRYRVQENKDQIEGQIKGYVV
jgi:hypothetical protein